MWHSPYLAGLAPDSVLKQTLKQLESQRAKQEAQKRLEDRRMQQSRKRARDLLGKMAPRASQHDGGGESEARRAPGCIEVGAVGQDVPGWCEVYDRSHAPLA